MEEKKILGFRKFNSKLGKPFCIVQVYAPYTDRDVSFGACGNKCEELWVPEEFHGIFTSQCIGKMVQVTYTISAGKAYIASVSIK